MRRLAGEDFELELRVLGCSHQVIVRRPGLEGAADRELSEVVACLPGTPPGLPARYGREEPGERYLFRSRVLRLEPTAHATWAEQLIAAAHDDPDALIGVFPGLPGAVTGLRCRAEPGALGWSTWHTYPQTGEVVETETRLEWAAP